ncbi:alpha/beta hydrolase family protein [Streptomyces sp. NPDC058467]|uniref:S9 family peptidase n=1 Tax=Streptomyces sp. NPDC058467 TaxID=3346513 RepID=UPI00364B6DD2
MTDPYQVFRGSLPDVCPRDATRMVFVGNAGGRCEVFAWDATARRSRQVTDRAGGTAHCAIDADGYVWWFEDDAEGRGRWWYQAFEGGPRLPGLPGAPAGQTRGLAVAPNGTVATAVGDSHGTTVLVGQRGRVARELLRTPTPVRLAGLSATGDLVAVAALPGDDAAVTVLTTDGESTAVLPGPEGPATRLWCLGFSPRHGDRSLLLVQENGHRYVLGTWTPEAGLTTHPWCSFDTEVTARWYPDGRGVLVRQERHGRSLLHRVDLRTRRRTHIPAPAGSLLDAAPRAGGSLHYVWTDTAHPPELRTTDGVALPPAGAATLVPGRHTALWTPTADGPVHTLLSLPEAHGTAAPPPAVFLVHGGPADHDRDAYDATVHSLAASGYAVVRVNYRGSTGYGPDWRRAFTDGIGHTQVRDLVAVRADLVRRRLIAEQAVALWGVSWGGYLVLLALGTQPGLWQAGVAVKPVADWVAAHRSTTPALRALDVRMFGGTPDEVPERYARSSPLTYAADVTEPLFVVGATKDTKCPPGQIRAYLKALDEAGVGHEAMWLDTGHDGYDGAAHVAVLRRSLRFLHTHLPAARRPAGHQRPPARTGGSRSH